MSLPAAALTLPADNHACSASAFVAMSLAYTRSSAYLIAAVVSLLYLSGYQQVGQEGGRGMHLLKVLTTCRVSTTA